GCGAGGGRQGPLGPGCHFPQDGPVQKCLEVSGGLPVEFGHGQGVPVGGDSCDGPGFQVQLQPVQQRQSGVVAGAGAQQFACLVVHPVDGGDGDTVGVADAGGGDAPGARVGGLGFQVGGACSVPEGDLGV